MIDYLIPKETDRLHIRALTLEDIPAWIPFVMNVQANRFFPEERKGSPDKAAFWIEGQLKRYADNRYGLMALVEKSSGELTGLCGLLAQVVDGKDEIEIGYHLLPAHWGKGYATEAAKKFKSIAFEKRLSESVISLIHPANKPSQKVAGRNGMKRSSVTMHHGMEAIVYRVDKV